jgi:hypothetical protein
MFVPQDASFGFRVIPLKFPASSLFFIGKHEQIEKARGHCLRKIERLLPLLARLLTLFLQELRLLMEGACVESGPLHGSP